MTSEGPFWLLSDFSVHRSVKDIQNKQTKTTKKQTNLTASVYQIFPYVSFFIFFFPRNLIIF